MMPKIIKLKRMLIILAIDMTFLCCISRWIANVFKPYFETYDLIGRILLVLSGSLCVIIKHELWHFQHPMLLYFPWWFVILVSYAVMLFSFILLMRVKGELALVLSILGRVLAWVIYLLVTLGSEYFAFYIMQKS